MAGSPAPKMPSPLPAGSCTAHSPGLMYISQLRSYKGSLLGDVLAVVASRGICTAQQSDAAWRKVEAVYAAATHDGRLHLRLKLARIVGLHLGCLLVQGVIRVGVLHHTVTGAQPAIPACARKQTLHSHQAYNADVASYSASCQGARAPHGL